MEFYELSETARIKLELDTFNNEFSDVLGDTIGLVMLNNHGLTEFAPYDKTARLEARDFISSDYTFTYNLNRLRAYGKYLATAQGSSIRALTLTGYSQGEWAEALIYVNGATDGETVLDFVQKDVMSWFRGDVYTLTAQTKKTYTAADGESVELWNDGEAFGGYLLEYGTLDQETAEQFATEAGLVEMVEA